MYDHSFEKKIHILSLFVKENRALFLSLSLSVIPHPVDLLY